MCWHVDCNGLIQAVISGRVRRQKMERTANIVPLFGSDQARGPIPDAGDPLRGRWAQVSALALLWWSDLNADDVEAVSGRKQLARLVQRRYARTREDAEMEVNRFLIRVGRLFQAG